MMNCIAPLISDNDRVLFIFLMKFLSTILKKMLSEPLLSFLRVMNFI